MFKLRHIFNPVNAQDEREFERLNVQRKQARYLETNPLDRHAQDDAYRTKVERIESGLNGIQGFILDIGGNTAGEATILQQKGFNMVVGDINQLALDLSRQRVQKFGLKAPAYVALDAHRLPFVDGSFSAVTVIEALHHFADYGQTLGEIHRVLKPGGKLVSIEPNGLNPIRRLSELRDRLRGTIEKSFFVSQLNDLCTAAGFERTSIQSLATGKSSWKMQEVPAYRRSLAKLHGYLGIRFPTVFGVLKLETYKPGILQDDAANPADFPKLLQCPICRQRISFDPIQELWVATDGTTAFPDHNGIPVLVAEDAVPVKNINTTEIPRTN